MLYYPENYAMNSLKHVLQMEDNGTRGAGTIESGGSISPQFDLLARFGLLQMTFQHSTPPLLMKSD